MILKFKEKEKAIKLRRKGFSYSEILKEIPVAKSTLSLWLRSVGLSKRQKQRLTEKKMASIKRGWAKWHQQKLELTAEIKNKARTEIGKISQRELLLIGIALYWAEGHKEKTKGSLVQFSNSDPMMIMIFLKWLQNICVISSKDITFKIFLHETSKNRLLEIQRYWAKSTGFPINNFQKIYFKKNKIRTKRRNVRENYYGVLRVVVGRSINFNRKIQGWISGICSACR